MKDYLNNYWRYIEDKNTKQAKKIYEYLNKDRLYSIIVDNNVYWLETTSMNTNIPNYIYEDIKRYMNKKGYTYLYDIKTRF